MVTMGGLLPGSLIYTGIKPTSGNNVALVFTPASGSCAVPENCVSLHELYFACTTTNEISILNLALGCDLDIETYGQAVDGKPGPSLAVQKVTFTPVIKSNLLPPPTLPIYSDMVKVVSILPPTTRYEVRATILKEFGFLNDLPEILQEILITYYEEVGELASALLFDNITYTSYETDTKCNLPSQLPVAPH